jgi:hypothetical protein
MGSLPPGHSIETTYAEGILKRVKGNMVEAVEILLDEIHLYDEDGDGAGDGDGDCDEENSEGQYSLVEEILLGEEESASTSSGSMGKVTTPDMGEGAGELEVEVELGEELSEEGDEGEDGYRIREGGGTRRGVILTKEPGGLRIGQEEVRVIVDGVRS